MGGGTGANPRGPPGTPSRYGQGLRGCDLSQEIRPRRKTRGGGSEKLLARRRQQVKPRRLPAGVNRPDGETETQREQQSPEPPRRSHPLPIPVPIPLPSTAQGPPPKVLPGAGPHPAASRDKVECPLWTKGNKTFF
ncbi:uncharacterized protein LOC119881624 isoform X5 [Canis lupus familiaris]|uniref:uncharacterized protein LOC119881624 isoform X5 n=1 Tax=Canis lupus familiaris TaxID=9615 RepID=UPI0015F1AF02|nr:uncharacterized protein LOC119881624 isoform X5 [Canis lupus familiaris]